MTFHSLYASPSRAMMVLMLVCAAFFLPGIAGVPPMDRDEPRFAQASKQMLETRDFVDIRFQEEPRHKKPIGIYWLQSAVVSAGEALGVDDAKRQIWLYRIPSFLGAIAVVLLTFWLGTALMGQGAAFFAALMMASSILLNVEARLAKTDAVLVATIMLALAAFAHMRKQQNFIVGSLSFWPLPLLFWLGLALSVLIKGPVGLMVVGFAVGACFYFERFSLKNLHIFKGLLFLLLLVAPWFVAIALESKGAFFAESLGDDFAAKIAKGQESHGAWPGTYLLVFIGTFWPASILAFVAAPLVWAQRKDVVVRFLLGWLVPTWLVLELIPTKLPHYVLPLYPAIALLIAYVLFEKRSALPSRLLAFAPWLWPLCALALCGALVGALFYYEQLILWWLFLPLLFAVAAAIYAAVLLRRVEVAQGLAIVAFSSFLLIGSVLGLAAPYLQTLWISSRLASAAAQVSCPSPRLASTGFREPSLVFLTRTDLEMTDGAGAARFLQQLDCALSFVEGRQRAAFDAELARLDFQVERVANVKGININGGRKMDIDVLRRVQP